MYGELSMSDSPTSNFCAIFLHDCIIEYQCSSYFVVLVDLFFHQFWNEHHISRQLPSTFHVNCPFLLILGSISTNPVISYFWTAGLQIDLVTFNGLAIAQNGSPYCLKFIILISRSLLSFFPISHCDKHTYFISRSLASNLIVFMNFP